MAQLAPFRPGEAQRRVSLPDPCKTYQSVR